MVSSSARLPMKVAMLPALPVKVATYKVTVETNKPPVNLNDLFPGENQLLLLKIVYSPILIFECCIVI